MRLRFTVFFILALLCFPVLSHSQSYVRASGTRILDINGDNLIIRSIGTGNWMLQEGYMMGTSGATNGTQWDFRRKLIQTIGLEKTNEYYNKWWDCHFNQTDVDSMKVWGFNTIRPALHYKIFTLPIEDEPVKGQDTWLEDGFARLDSLVKWCHNAKMYLVLDMHGCPGAQGSDSNISDYDSSKPSLWESEENKRKLVALWKKIAERYATEQWIAGYDLINEPKWDALKSNGNNKDLWDLFKRMIDEVRKVDKNHLIFLAGNSWGNDYAGLPNLSTWGGNLALSFHKYWNGNGSTALDWIINLGNQHNVPVWLGETGENSNTWFADVIRLCESKNVGWSMWPVKKMGGNNILRSKSNNDYQSMLTAWRNGTSINATTAYNGVMRFAEDHKLQNCRIQYDVIDAMITRPHTNEPRPFKKHDIEKEIFAVDYDFGPIGYAYFDNADVDYHGSEGTYTQWNNGSQYRNDGVDIQTSSDSPGNGYSIGWIEDGEWLHYTINVPETKSYAMQFRYSSQSGGARVYVEVNGKRASKTVSLSSTNSWTTWSTAIISGIVLPAGNAKVKIVFEKAGCNFNYFKFFASQSIETMKFEMFSAQTDKAKNELNLFFNQPVDEVEKSSFTVKINGETTEVASVKKDADNSQEIVLGLSNDILFGNTITIEYAGENCKSGTKNLEKFSNIAVDNKLIQHAIIPAKIEAENFAVNNGFTFQTCEDTDGGQNAGYTDSGDYLDYVIYTNYAGEHTIDFRVAVNVAAANIVLYNIGETNTAIKTVRFTNTGGWQVWRTQSTTANLKKGKNVLRIHALSSGFNINWFEIKGIPGASVETLGWNNWKVYPNPVKQTLYVTPVTMSEGPVTLSVYNMTGKLFLNRNTRGSDTVELDVGNFDEGLYILKIQTNDYIINKKFTHIH